MSGKLQSAIDDMDAGMRLALAQAWRLNATAPNTAPENARLWLALAHELELATFEELKSQMSEDEIR